MKSTSGRRYWRALCFLVSLLAVSLPGPAGADITNDDNRATIIIGQPLAFCGDGILQPGEECDDGTVRDCSEPCPAPYCGDGIVQDEEECDDGNGINDDECSTLCLARYCGDGVVQVELGEECDDGGSEDGDGCSYHCYVESCGDGILQSGLGEECDDSNTVNGDGCDALCSYEFCGNGVIDSAYGEECDDGNNLDGDGCAGACYREGVCGDGIVQPGMGEDCDDGNADDNDGCSSFCREEYCGDAIVQPGEECDLGFEYDGCVECTVRSCGDGIVQPGEECDDGNEDDTDGCNRFCFAPPARCGDGLVQEGEECDDGKFNGFGTCTEQCTKCEECDACSAVESTQQVAFGNTLAVTEGIALQATEPKGSEYTDLKNTGLYKNNDTQKREINDRVRPYEPQYPLWSDGLKKNRWVFLPCGEQINVKNVDRWEFPKGAKFWKEFSFGGYPVETRLIEKVADKAGPASWRFYAFRWEYKNGKFTGNVPRVTPGDVAKPDKNPGGAPYTLLLFPTIENFPDPIKELAKELGPDGKKLDRHDEGHKIPDWNECLQCHKQDGEDVILGFDYLQLSTARDPNSPNIQNKDREDLKKKGYIDLEFLKKKELLENEPKSFKEDVKVAARTNQDTQKESAAERAMIGYLHGNCGSCHNEKGTAQSKSLRLRFADAHPTDGKNEAGEHGVNLTAIGRRTAAWKGPDGDTIQHIKSPGALNVSKESAIHLRMLARDQDHKDPNVPQGNQMPPLATKVQDAQALELLKEWIEELPKLQMPKAK